MSFVLMPFSPHIACGAAKLSLDALLTASAEKGKKILSKNLVQDLALHSL